MKIALIVAFIAVASIFAAHRTVTITTLDTIKITQTFNDTTILIKQDTVIVKGAIKPKGK